MNAVMRFQQFREPAVLPTSASSPSISYSGGMTQPRPHVNGIEVDAHTRCTHYRTPLDIIAIRMKCCGTYYACKDCHIALADHPIALWPQSQWNQEAILCGACDTQLTIQQYLAGDNRCPACDALFNPGCRNHYHFYFESPQHTA